MAAAVILPVSGPYVSTWQAFPIGILNDDGFQMRCTVHGQEVSGTDQYGKTLIEGVYQGQDWRCRMVGLEWSVGMTAALQVFGQFVQTFPVITNLIAPTLTAGTLNAPLSATTVNVGDLYSNYWEALVLTAVLGEPPTSPQAITALNAIIAPEVQAEFMMTSKVRELPLEFCLIPYAVSIGSMSGMIVPFTAL